MPTFNADGAIRAVWQEIQRGAQLDPDERLGRLDITTDDHHDGLAITISRIFVGPDDLPRSDVAEAFQHVRGTLDGRLLVHARHDRSGFVRILFDFLTRLLHDLRQVPRPPEPPTPRPPEPPTPRLPWWAGEPLAPRPAWAAMGPHNAPESRRRATKPAKRPRTAWDHILADALC